MSDEDKRLYTRIPAEVVVRLRKATVKEKRGAAHKTFVRNVSMGGAFIETDMEFDAEDLIEADLALPPRNEAATIVGRIRWRKRDTSPGIGVEFLQIATSSSTDDLDMIQAYIEHELLQQDSAVIEPPQPPADGGS